MGRQSWTLALLVISLHVMAQWAGATFEIDEPLGVASIATGVLVFLWLLSWEDWSPGERMTREARIRSAIAGGVVAQYLSLVATVTFFGGGSETMQAVTQAFVTSFTAVVTVVIAFYFGASAYVEGRKAESDAPPSGGP